MTVKKTRQGVGFVLVFVFLSLRVLEKVMTSVARSAECLCL